MFVAVVLLTVALVIVSGLLAAVLAAVLVRRDGGTRPTALKHATTAFAAVITLAAAVTGALSAVLT
ncbi:hypothetical protein [Streptomyces sp. CBMAI 2042]|uniref:hypothetical protein n=1 Tax=Streptomyces sp. CBMAI 2042 TaxID=2305222 RepID=UPI001F393367|nr:hypothetical protein [Streptomyces sp. CBMAI 2042]